MRQLNIYGFTRTEAGSYSHEYFLRGRADLLHKIQRIPVKSGHTTAVRTPSRSPVARSPAAARSPPMQMHLQMQLEPSVIAYTSSSDDSQCSHSPNNISDMSSDLEDDIPLLSDVEVEILVNFEQ
jgi:hypothetical protein